MDGIGILEKPEQRKDSMPNNSRTRNPISRLKIMVFSFL
jgi:hypothetical protein